MQRRLSSRTPARYSLYLYLFLSLLNAAQTSALQVGNEIKDKIVSRETSEPSAQQANF